MIIGIDLGTTNSLATTYKNGEVVFIPNPLGHYLTPSVVSVAPNHDIIVGEVAKERLVTAPEYTFSMFKRDMGRDIQWSVYKQPYTPELLSGFIIRQLVNDAEAYLKTKVTKAVVSVPAYFNALQRSATKRAGEMAGVKVEVLVNEPSAAALTCRDESADEAFIVFDFGGGTLDVSIVESFMNIININVIAGDNHLGGRDFDQLIVQIFCQENQLIVEQLTSQEQEILIKNAEAAKMNLGSGNKNIQMAATIHDTEYTMTLNNQLLYDASHYLFERIRKVLAKAINDSGLTTEDISKCILVGGACGLTVVQRYLKNVLKLTIVQPDRGDQVVARGLGIYTGIKMRSEKVKSLVLTDICPFSLGTSIRNPNSEEPNLMSVIIPRNATLPITKMQTYSTNRHGQKRVNLPVIQGDSYYAKDNLELGVLVLPVPYNKTGYESVEVAFTYDINATLIIETHVLSTGEKRTFVVRDNQIIEDIDLATPVLEKSRAVAAQLFDPLLLPLQLLTERALSMYEDSIEPMRGLIAEILMKCERLDEQTSLVKRNKEIQKYNQLLDEIERFKSEHLFFAEQEKRKIIDINEVRRNGHMENPSD